MVGRSGREAGGHIVDHWAFPSYREITGTQEVEDCRLPLVDRINMDQTMKAKT